MQHLNLEEIARLVDEAPEPREAEHLRSCLVCRAELKAMRAQTEELAGLAEPEPSPRAWAALETRLRAEGLIRPARTLPRWYGVLRIAASVAFLALAGTGGVALWKAGAKPGESPAPPMLAEVPATAPERYTAPGPAGETLPAAPAPALETGVPVRLASLGGEAGEAPPRAMRRGNGADEAAHALRETEAAYLRALAQYAELADSSRTADPVARLAALEGLVRVTRSALERAPGDPVINGYYLAALGERDAMLSRLARTTEETWY